MIPKYQRKKSAENEKKTTGSKKCTIKSQGNVSDVVMSREDAETKFSAKSLRRSQASLGGGGGCHGVVP